MFRGLILVVVSLFILTGSHSGKAEEERLNKLLNQMTLEEKVMMLSGTNSWFTNPIERLGIPAIKVTDGPNGARGATQGEMKSACFPCGIALASTWNTELIGRVGQAIAEGARSKGAHVLLAPTVNIHRSPLNGRNFECYSEDPYLTAKIAVAFIRGVQSQGVGATIKHFVCNDSEFERRSISSQVDERTLREVYLPPFETAVRDAGVWAVMSAYNRVNGTYCSENRHLLLDILKGEWGFDGVVMSDWGGTYSTVEAANNGLDLEMPNANFRGEKLVQAVREGKVDEAAIDQHVSRLLRLIHRLGAFENPGILEEQSVDRPEHRALAREAASEAMVLLKNDRGILPLDAAEVRSIAIIGPNAREARIMGGGSSQVTPHYAVSPFQGIQSKVGDTVNISYALGCSSDLEIPVLDATWVTPAQGEAEHGFSVEYFDNPDFAGEPVHIDVVSSGEVRWTDGSFPVDIEAFAGRFSGTLNVPATGRYSFNLGNIGRARLYIDGQLVIDHWNVTPVDAILADTIMFEMEMLAGKPYHIKLEYYLALAAGITGFRIGCRPPAGPGLAQAAELAAQADVALLFLGSNSDWESEGHDRPHMDLIGEQVALIEAVTAANPDTIVILNIGSPITMPWLDKVPAVLLAWFPGQECGNAIADVLFGDTDPSGRLTQTFPKQLQDNPAYINYPGENGKVCYGEGIFVGYRYYEMKGIEPLFPFGSGLSYTTFAYSNLRLSAEELNPGDELRVLVDVTNTGTRAGKEVVQLYVRDPESRLMRPKKELKGFAKVALEPGETSTVTLPLTTESLAFYDDRQQQWIAEPGEFEVLLGRSSRDIRAKAGFRLVAAAAEARVLGLDTPIRYLLVNEEARRILAKHLPGMLARRILWRSMNVSLKQLARFTPDRFTEEVLEAIAKDLAELQIESHF